MVYEPREYRSRHREDDLHHFQVRIGETDLDVGIKKSRFRLELVKKVEAYVTAERQVLQEYIQKHPDFLTALEPWRPEPSKEEQEQIPAAVRAMCRATELAGVGPMAAVAGWLAERTGTYLARYSRDVIVENGGDIWLKSSRTRKVSIYAGDSPFSHQIGLEIRPDRTPLGICTSSGTVGHSLSFGRADAVVILAPSAVLADAVATAACNRVQGTADLQKTVEWALTVPGVTGALAVLADKLAVKGEIKLLPL
ncbi:MAG TPA: UPF0280 family protein [Clostridia bacterium]|nr:UPF0280 family protein [Clostridia bacterium]